MIRSSFAALISVLLAAPSFAAPVEIVRLDAAPRVETAPTFAAFAPTVASALTAPSLQAPAPALTAAFAPAPSLGDPKFQAVPAAAPAVAPIPAANENDPARGPPSPRESAGVAATVATVVRSWSAPVESILSDHEVLLMGENHGSLSSVDTIAKEMPRLAAAGVKTVGIEGLKRPHQKEVDDFVGGRTDAIPEAALGFSPRRRKAFEKLLIAARTSGVRVVALGVPLEHWTAQVAELAAARTGKPASSFGGGVGVQFSRAQDRYEPGFNESVAEVFIARRNDSMAAFLADALKTGGKAVVLVGQAHVEGLDFVPGRLMNAPGDWGSIARSLWGLGLRAYSLTMTGGLFVDASAAAGDRDARPESYRAAAAASKNGAPAYRELGPHSGLWHAGGRIPTADDAL